jgi:hypothetical protein
MSVYVFAAEVSAGGEPSDGAEPVNDRELVI